jgi:hypothetical protein
MAPAVPKQLLWQIRKRKTRFRYFRWGNIQAKESVLWPVALA